MTEKIPPKEVCEDCKGLEDYWDGQFTSDDSFYCNYCLDKLIELQKEQYEN